MNTSIQILPGIKRLGFIDGSRLPRRVDLTAICGGCVTLFSDINEICFFGDPKLVRKRSQGNPGPLDTVTLEFVAGNELPELSNIAFVLTDVNGNSFLIGSREHPHPVVVFSHRIGSPAGDPAGFAYEISHTALRSLIPCQASFQ